MTAEGPHGNKFTPERCAKILKEIGRGYTMAYACMKADMDVRTLSRWRLRAADPEHPDQIEFIRFFDQVEVEKLGYEGVLEGVLLLEARSNPKVALELLALRRPEEFGKKRAADVSVSVGNYSRANIFLTHVEGPVDPKYVFGAVDVDEDDDV